MEYNFRGVEMSWYKLAQEQERNLIQQGLGTASNPAGILVTRQDYNEIMRFINNPNNGPVSVQDKDTGNFVSIIHGSMSPDGKFAFSKGNNQYVFPENEADWAEKLNVNRNNMIISCYAGQAPADAFKTAVPYYRGKLEISAPQQFPEGQEFVRINVMGK